MTALVINAFGGISPKIRPRYLADTQAQTALNCLTANGSLQPQIGLGASLLTLPAGTLNSIYRFGQEQDETQYWFAFSDDVNVVRGPVAGDTEERTYYSGVGTSGLRETWSSIALSATPYPANYRLVGVPKPTDAPTLAVVGTPDEGVAAETRVYIYTYVNDKNEESAPSPASASIDVTPTTQTVTVTMAVPSGSNRVYSAKRIYRSVSGTFLFVAEVADEATTFSDNKLAEDLGEECPSLTWDAPISTLKGLVALPNGVMAAFSGRDVYFSDPYHPFAWPAIYSQTLDHPIVGLGVMDTTLVVLTKGTPYFIQGTHPDSMAVVRSDVEQACVSKRSIVSVNGAVLYASPDGLVMLSSSGSKILTDKMFTYAQWQSIFAPANLHAYQHDLKYIAFGSQGGFTYDLLTGQFTQHDLTATAGHHDVRNDTLFLANDNKLVKWDKGNALRYTWRSKMFSLPQITGFSCAQVEAESYGYTTGTVTNAQNGKIVTGIGTAWLNTVHVGDTLLLRGKEYPITHVNSNTEISVYLKGSPNNDSGVINEALTGQPYVIAQLKATFYLDGALWHTQPVLNRQPFRLPPKQGRDIEVLLEGSREVFKVAIAQSMSEIAGV
jgi:hypothetical protein